MEQEWHDSTTPNITGRRESFRLHFSPSPELTDIVSGFYKPEFQSKAGEAVLRSVQRLDLLMGPGRQPLYSLDRDNQIVNNLHLVSKFEEQLEHHISRHRLPVISFIETAFSDGGEMALLLKASPSKTDRILLGVLPEFRLQPSEALDVFMIIPKKHSVDREEAAKVKQVVESMMGNNHPARNAVPEVKRYVGEGTYLHSAALRTSG